MRLTYSNAQPADVFVEDRYGPSERRRRELAREQVWWRRHLRWIARWPRPLRVIIVLFELAAVYTLFVVGLTLGVAVRALIF